MKDYRYILFDLDGTVTDPKVGITKSVAYALRYFGIETANLDDLCKFIGPPLKQSFMEYYCFDESKSTLAVEKYREYFGVTGLYENTVYDGLEKLMQKLVGQGRTLIIATSKPTVFAVKILEHFDLLKYFAFVAGSELDGTRTKKSEVIAYALQQNHITDLSSAIMIGDRKHDIIGAKEVGLDSIGVLFGYGDLQEHEQAGANHIVSTVDELSALWL